MIHLLVMVAKKPAAKLNFPELILEPATAKDLKKWKIYHW